MSTVLYIKANCKSETSSRTFKISDGFINTYKNYHPKDEVLTLDLYKEDIRFLSEEDVHSVFGPKDKASKNHSILKYAYQFAQADKYVIAEPMWNLGIPAILKAYVDYVSVTGITFKYTDKGPVGLLKGKKAVNIVSRGGNYSSEPFNAYEMGDRYLKTILGFFGITDYYTISAENLDVIGEDVEDILKDTIRKAENLAEKF